MTSTTQMQRVELTEVAMGFISKRVNGRANQELAAPVAITTHLSPGEIRTVIQEVLAEHNNALAAANNAKVANAGGKLSKAWAEAGKAKENLDSYYFGHTADGSTILISYQKPVSEAAKGVSHQGYKLSQVIGQGHTDGHWLAGVKIFGPPEAAPNGPNRLVLQLRSWVTDKDSGKMQNKAKFEQLVDLLTAAITERDMHQPTLLS